MMKKSWPLRLPEAQSPAANTIQLYQGWNLVGYNSLKSKALEDCMSSVQGKLALVWSYDPDRGWLWYVPDAPEQSTLRSMEPGKGYLIKATEDCIWDTN